jgi:hypothetical protein
MIIGTTVTMKESRDVDRTATACCEGMAAMLSSASMVLDEGAWKLGHNSSNPYKFIPFKFCPYCAEEIEYKAVKKDVD